ncbi:MAG: RNA-binding transcriptional accessory protein [Gemmatimonadetes bacterium]|nr:RNA-binding transcriptional accessory protein [Gemmatimonadota bacterium]
MGVGVQQVRATAALVADGATVPFIARYRKEATGSLDELQITAIRDRMAELAELDRRRASILTSLDEQGIHDQELRRRIAAADSFTVLEDLYLPYRPKRRTRGMMAREAGLEPLARTLLAQTGQRIDLAEYDDPEAALAGARDIIAEDVSEDAQIRGELRTLFAQRAVLSSSVVKNKEEEGDKFRDWFEWSEPLSRAPSHRVLAILRGGNAGVLRVQARPDEEEALARLRRRFLRGRGFASEQVALALEDAYKRLLLPSLEREALKEAKARADEEAIRGFVTNVRELLMAPPLRGKRILAVDPGFRTGCKTVALDARGALLHSTTIFPTMGERGRGEAEKAIRGLVRRFEPEAVAVGNGTAGRETEAFLRGLELGLPVVTVDEAGASIYSASEVAREEMPDQDVTVRGAVSIGRRLQDPLAELVKLDPKSIGVGQYQHDVDQRALKTALDDTVTSCVNAVGVELNSASPSLLTYVAGLGPTLARNVVRWREENGPFRSRRDLLKVPRLGAKAFEQAAGFLRLPDGSHPLDASAVHPERYDLVERMAGDQGCAVADLLRDGSLRARIQPEQYVSEGVGRPTIDDILDELVRPGRDPRGAFEAFSFADVHALEDLREGMVLPGIVTNVTAFGAFVDVGVHQDGLVHVSQLADRYVKDPNEVVRVRQRVRVRVLQVDTARRRIGLSMKGL